MQDKVFGYLPKEKSIVIPSGHLGHETAEDAALSDGFIERLTAAIAGILMWKGW